MSEAMTPEQILDALEAAGAGLVMKDGQPRLRGKQLPAELLEAVKTQRAAVMAAWQARQGAVRVNRLPTEPLPLSALHLKFPEPMRQAVVNHVLRQSPAVYAWITRRADEYFERNCEVDDCEWRACVDLVAWQRRSSDPKDVQHFLEGMDECMATLPVAKEASAE